MYARTDAALKQRRKTENGTTVSTVFPEAPVISVRVSAEIPKERIFDVMREINKVSVRDRFAAGTPVIRNVLGLGVDVIVTSGILKEENSICQKGEEQL